MPLNFIEDGKNYYISGSGIVKQQKKYLMIKIEDLLAKDDLTHQDLINLLSMENKLRGLL